MALLQGINNFIVGSSTPTIQTSSGKMVIDSPGIEAALELLSAGVRRRTGRERDSAVQPERGQLTRSALFQGASSASRSGSNYYGGNWTKFISARTGHKPVQTMGVAELADRSGRGHREHAGWMGPRDFVARFGRARWPTTSSTSLRSPTNLIDAANWAGWVPPVAVRLDVPAYTNFAPPFNADFAKVLPVRDRDSRRVRTTRYGCRASKRRLATLCQNPNTTVTKH